MKLMAAALVLLALSTPSVGAPADPAFKTDAATNIGTCLLGVCMDSAGADFELKRRLGDGASSTGDGNTRCYYVPSRELFVAAGFEPSATPARRLDFLYLGRYPWPDCARSDRVTIAEDLLATAEGLRIGDAEQEVTSRYRHADGFEIQSAQSQRTLLFRPKSGRLLTEIGVVAGKVVTVYISHSD